MTDDYGASRDYGPEPRGAARGDYGAPAGSGRTTTALHSVVMNRAKEGGVRERLQEDQGLAGGG